MVEVLTTELVFSFPEVDASAELRIHFQHAASPGRPIPIARQSVPTEFRFACAGRMTMQLRPKVVGQRSWPGWPTETLRFPFAIIASVGGLNALTGDRSNTLVRAPQNYFVSPPQGGIDGYFVGNSVHPFRITGDAALDSTRLDLSVFPMKAETWRFLMDRRRRCGGEVVDAIAGQTLTHGGERQCEPLYEDPCCLGDWDQNHVERATIWLRVSGNEGSKWCRYGSLRAFEEPVRMNAS
jgi:hypothetical protein